MVGVSELCGTIARSDSVSTEDMEFIGTEGIMSWTNPRTPPVGLRPRRAC